MYIIQGKLIGEIKNKKRKNPVGPTPDYFIYKNLILIFNNR